MNAACTRASVSSCSFQMEINKQKVMPINSRCLPGRQQKAALAGIPCPYCTQSTGHVRLNWPFSLQFKKCSALFPMNDINININSATASTNLLPSYLHRA